MAILDVLKSLKSDKKAVTAVTVLGAVGLLLIMLSSLLPGEKKEEEKRSSENQNISAASADYCTETEKKLADFLEDIDGVGKVRVYLTVGGEEQYVYATEGKTSIAENKTEEERKYVMIGGGSEKSALIETVKAPEISGAVIACTGADSPVVREMVYEAASTALDLTTGQIYVTKLR